MEQTKLKELHNLFKWVNDTFNVLQKAQDDYKYHIQCLCEQWESELKSNIITIDDVEIESSNRTDGFMATINMIIVDSDNHTLSFHDTKEDRTYLIDDINIKDAYAIMVSLMMTARVEKNKNVTH